MYRFLTSFYRSGLVLTGTESVVLHMSEGGTTRVSGTAYAVRRILQRSKGYLDSGQWTRQVSLTSIFTYIGPSIVLYNEVVRPL